MRPATGHGVRCVSGRPRLSPANRLERCLAFPDSGDTLRSLPLVDSRTASPRPLPSCRHYVDPFYPAECMLRGQLLASGRGPRSRQPPPASRRRGRALQRGPGLTPSIQETWTVRGSNLSRAGMWNSSISLSAFGAGKPAPRASAEGPRASPRHTPPRPLVPRQAAGRLSFRGGSKPLPVRMTSLHTSQSNLCLGGPERAAWSPKTRSLR